MRRSRPAAARLSLLIVAALGLTAAVLPRAHASGLRAVADGTGGKVAGASLADQAPGGGAEAASAVDRLHADGINTVSLYVWWLADSATASSVHPFTDPLSGTEDDTSLSAEIALARAAGLRVILVPVFYCNGCPGGSRSLIHPADLAGFFASYTNFVDHYAALAQASGVSTFFVGSELSSLEPATNQWRTVIGGVRRLFHGQVAYEENWDVLGNAHYLDAVDLVGVSAYFPLDANPSPSLGRLLADWRSSSMPGWQGRNWVAEVAHLVAVYHKPVLFGEVGYMSGNHAAARPYLDWYDVPNMGLQADLYQALLETFQGYGWWAGAVWWVYQAGPDGAGNGRTFAGKQAETTLQLWYADGVRPQNPATPLIPAA